MTRLAVCAAVALLAALRTYAQATTAGARAHRALRAVSWSKLPGWRADDALAAWPAHHRFLQRHARHARSGSRSAGPWSRRARATPSSCAHSSSSSCSPIASCASPDASARRPASSPATTSRCCAARANEATQFATPLYRRPEDLLVVDLADVIPELKGKRVRGRLEGNKVVPYFSRADIARGARARRPRDRLDRQCARCLPARSAGIGPCAANYRRDHPPAVRGPEWASLPLDRQISRRPGRHDHSTR